MRVIQRLLVGGALVLALAHAAAADIVFVAPAYWTGSRSTPVDVEATDGWTKDNGGFRISWEITLSDGIYTYTYTFSNVSGDETIALDPEVSNLILEVSENISVGDLVLYYENFTFEGPQWWTKDPNYPNSTEDPGANEGRPNQPEDIYGIKLEPDGPNLSYTFQSPQAPVWGDFYAKDGTPKSGVVATAWNAGIGTDPDPGQTDFSAWIPTPDTYQGAPPVIPAPPAVLLGVLGLGLAGVIRQPRR